MHPVLLDLGRVKVYTYGVLIAVGGVFSMLFWLKHWQKMGLKSEDDLWLLLNIMLISGFIGARLLDLFEDVGVHSPIFWKAAFSLNQGFAAMGGVCALIVAVYGFCLWKKISFLRLADYLCVAIAFWHFFGRLGCFSAGCCFGLPMSRHWPWAVTFSDPRALINPLFLRRPVHPTQLYEAFGELINGLVVYAFILKRIEKEELPRGTAAAASMAFYAVLRFMVEFYRGDVTMLPIGLTEAQAFCLGMLAFSAGIFAYARRRI